MIKATSASVECVHRMGRTEVVRSELFLRCARCKVTTTLRGRGDLSVRQGEAKAVGWTADGGVVKCPTCAAAKPRGRPRKVQIDATRPD